MRDVAAIRVNNLTKVYKLYDRPADRIKEALNPFKKRYHNDFYALNSIDFTIMKGEIVGIIGTNGSGKSTFLKIVAGVLAATSGNIESSGKISALLELGAGFNPELTGVENIHLNGAINGFSDKEMDARISEIVEFADIGDFIHHPVKMYSSGMKARLAFAVSIHIDPDILIIDEVLSVGDAAFQRKCFSKIEAFKKSGKTILFVSHSEGQIVELCDRAIMLHGGNLALDGHPKIVTGLYLKYSKNRDVDLAELKEEYLKKSITHTHELENQNVEAERKQENEEFFDVSLRSVSKVSYKESGASISDVKIKNMSGDEVNTLVFGREYIYSYKVSFDQETENVQFGMLIKTKQGKDIGGGAYPDKNSYIGKCSGIVEINWKFRCDMSDGVYFTNAGVSGFSHDKKEYLHRILDAYIFRVVSADPTFTGSVNLLSEVSIVGAAR